MIRPLAALAILSLTLGAAQAQQAVPSAAPDQQAVPAVAPDIVVDPAATFNTSPKQANMLTGFYATQAVIELCTIAIEPDIAAGMAADRARLETALGLDAAGAGAAYAKIRADVEKTGPDCADGSPDRLGVDTVTAIYAALPPPAAAAAPVEPPAPAAPAQ